MNGHHLILGQLTDFISGQTLDDTHDERLRQRIARLLVNEKGYAKSAITSRHLLKIQVDARCARLWVTYTIKIRRRIGMLVQYGPGSLVTRHRPALAMSRLIADYQVPVVVVTNGLQADILDGRSGRRMDVGLAKIPPKDRLDRLCKQHDWLRIPKLRAAKEARIVMAYEVDDRCPCDDSICTMGPDK